MLSLAQAMSRRGATGTPLPVVFPSLPPVNRGCVTLISGPPGAGKSILAMHLAARINVPTLGFLLDMNELTASARFASILNGENFLVVKDRISDGDESYHELLGKKLGDVQVVFYAPDVEDIVLQVDAFEQRYGLPPDLVVVDNLGNISSAYDPEWPVLKALILELDKMARRDQYAVLACIHMSDSTSDEPLDRTKILGKATQYARLILSVNFNEYTGEYKIAVVKNTEGKSDAKAHRPITLYADPARMLLSEEPLIHPQVALANMHAHSGNNWGGF